MGLSMVLSRAGLWSVQPPPFYLLLGSYWTTYGLQSCKGFSEQHARTVPNALRVVGVNSRIYQCMPL